MSLTPEAVCVVLSRVSRGTEELVAHDPLLPFQASYSAYVKYRRGDLPEKTKAQSKLPAGSGNHRPDGPKASHALTVKPDH